LDPSTDRPESRFLSVIIEEVDRLNRVVTQFLDYSKPHGGELQSLDLSHLVQKSVELMRPGIRTGIELEYVPYRVPIRVLATAEQIHQV